MSFYEHLSKLSNIDLNDFISEIDKILELYKNPNANGGAGCGVCCTIVIYLIKNFPSILILSFNLYKVFKLAQKLLRRRKENKIMDNYFKKLSEAAKEKKP